MDPGDQLNLDSSIPFTLEKSPYAAFGNDGINRQNVKPKLLILFPLKPAFDPLTSPLVRKNSVRSFSGETTQQISEQDSVVTIKGESEFESRDLDSSAVLLSSFLALHCVPEKTHLHIPLKKPRKEQFLVSSEAPCRVFVDSVCPQSSCPPSLGPYDTSAALRVQCLDGVGGFVDLKTRSTYQYNGASTSAFGQSKGSGSTFPSRASAINASPVSLVCAPSQHTTERQHAVGTLRPSARHGPRPRSSSFRGVTHYKRTGRWEAHIWNKGKQIYLGASSTAEKAARAYDRAAIHFRKMGAELNFYLEDYAAELTRLVELSEAELVTMLRKQSAGEGSMFPEYPPITELQEPPREIGTPKYFTVRERADQVEPRIHKKQLGSELVLNCFKADAACTNFVKTMVQSDHPQGESTLLHVPQAAHVYKRSGQYSQVIDSMTASLQNPQQ